jgi:hypothetical protein
MAFARNVLQAEVSAHLRQSQLRIAKNAQAEVNDVNARQFAQAEAARADLAEQQADNFSKIQSSLPLQLQGLTQLSPQERPVFYGFAELFGMARANFSPSDLGSFVLHCDPGKINFRTAGLLRSSHDILEPADNETPGPAERLEGMGVNVPEAMLMVERPERPVMIGSALRIIEGLDGG